MHPHASALGLLLSATLACTPTAPTTSSGPESAPAPSPKSAQEEIDEAVKVAPPPSITLIAEAPGRDPSEIESMVTTPLEAALRSISGVARLESRSSAGSATLTITFDPGVEIERARAAVFERLNETRSSIPDDVTTILAADLASRSRSTLFTLSPGTDRGASPDMLATVVDELRRELRQTPGVAAIEACGERPPQVLIAADPQRLKAYALTPLALRRALQAAPPSGPPGLVGVVDGAQGAGIEGLESLVITTAGEPPSPVYLRDLASISLAPAQPECDALHLGAGEVIVGVVRPHRGADEATVRAAVETLLRGQIERLSPRGVLLQVHPPPATTIHVEMPAPPLGEASRSLEELRRTLPTALPGGSQALLLAPRDEGPVDAEILLFGAPMGPDALRGLEERLAQLPGLHVRDIQSLGVASRQRLRIMGDDLELAYELAQEVARLAETVPGVLGAKPRTAMTPELTVHGRRDALARLGLTSEELAQTAALALHDVEVARRLIDGRDVPVILRIGERTVGHRPPEALGSIQLPLPGGGAVPLHAVADIRLQTSPHGIHHTDGRRSVDIDLRLAEPEIRAAVDRLLAAKLILPRGVVLTWE